MKSCGQAATDAERDVEAAILRVHAWRGHAPRYCPVGGGISNSNWRVRVPAGDYFVKIPGRGTEMFIDRAAAMDASRAAHALGVGPAVFDWLAADGIEIAEFVADRRPCTNVDFRDPAVCRSAVAALRRLHQAPPLMLTKTVFDMIGEHVAQVAQLGGWSPPDLPWQLRQVDCARAAVTASGFDMVPCFNDPMPGNFLVDDAKGVMLIDYEYASNNDRCYDLGIWFGEMFFGPVQEAELTEAYFGRVTAQSAARIRVYKALADIKWATWSMVQERVSALDFDYRKYGVWKHMRARRVMHDPCWPDWLRTL